jgi:hypothetical protein
MLSAIFVDSDEANVTIQAQETLQLTPLNHAKPTITATPLGGEAKVSLEHGIYKIVSGRETPRIIGPVEVVLLTGKDPPVDPNLAVRLPDLHKRFPEVSSDELRAFFVVPDIKSAALR